MPYATVPRDYVQSLVASIPVSREDINQIRDPRNPSRIQLVYAHRHGGVNRGDNRYRVKAYRARVFKFWELGSGFETREEAARAVVAFYKTHFGERWAHAFRARKVTPYRLRSVERGGAPAGFAVDIFVRGRPVGITRADAGEGRSPEWLWPSPEDAKRAARAALARRFEKERESLPIPAPGLVFWRG